MLCGDDTSLQPVGMGVGLRVRRACCWRESRARTICPLWSQFCYLGFTLLAAGQGAASSEDSRSPAETHVAFWDQGKRRPRASLDRSCPARCKGDDALCWTV